MAIYKKTSSANRNNFVGGAGSSLAIEYINQTWMRFDFGIHWSGANGAAISGALASVSLIIDPDTQTPNGSDVWPVDPIATVAPLRVVWSVGTRTGTIKETYYTFGTVLATRDDVDPGYGTIHIQDTDPVDEGRPGPRYTFFLAGAEYRIGRYAEKPTAVVASPSEGFPFPLGLLMTAASGVIVRNIVTGGAQGQSTIYSKRDQIEDFGSARNQLFTRSYQIGRYAGVDGLPVDVNTPVIT